MDVFINRLQPAGERISEPKNKLGEIQYVTQKDLKL